MTVDGLFSIALDETSRAWLEEFAPDPRRHVRFVGRGRRLCPALPELGIRGQVRGGPLSDWHTSPWSDTLRAMTIAPHHEYTFKEYVQLERDSPIKHEFLNGEIYAMTGGRRSTRPWRCTSETR